MTARILVVEPDPGDPSRWHYGLVDHPDAPLDPSSPVLRRRPDGPGFEPVGGRDAVLWPTVVLLLRRAARRRIVYDLTPSGARPGPPPASGGPWRRATDGRAKGRGETLAERARRARDDRPRAAA